ncbi:MAG: protein kinase [Planctomycetes bacterium]|nr:protein kinase [Planctomycetota bacterium]
MEEHEKDADFFVRIRPHIQAIDDATCLPVASAASWPTPDQVSNPVIEGYRIQEPIGRGGMGIVYRATQLNLNRVVALKVLPHVSPAADDMITRRFQREAAAAAKLQHGNIVPVHDFGQSGGNYFYTMELIPGWSLDKVIEFLQAYGPEPSSHAISELVTSVSATSETSPEALLHSVEQSGSGLSQHKAYYRIVAKWMADATAALGHAHEREVIHRDVKPSNMILAADGRIMMVDFGLAMAGGDSITQTGSLIGTLRYMSPEQAMAKRMTIDHRTDIYSLGATMYELLTLRPAIRGESRTEILGQVIAGEPIRPRKVVSGVPRELETVCLKAMEKMAASRYETARAMEDDLRRYLNDLPIIARPPSLSLRAIKFLRRHRFGAMAAVAAVAIAIAVIFAIQNQELTKEAGRTGQKLYGTEQLELSPLRDDPLLRNLYRLVDQNNLVDADRYAKSITSGGHGASNAYYIAARGFISIRRFEQSREDRSLLDRAISDYEECARLDPKFEAISHEGRGSAYYLRAMVFRGDEDYQRATSHYSRALWVQARFPRARSNRGHVYFDTRRYAEAMADYEIAVSAGFDDLKECISDFERTYYNYGTALRILGEPARAVVVYRLAIEANPKDVYSDVALALALLDLGQLPKADRCIEIARRKATSEDWIGKIARCFSGDLSHDDLLAAADGPGQKCEAHYYSGEMQLRAGHVDRALDAFDRCIATSMKGFNEYRFAEWRLSQLR